MYRNAQHHLGAVLVDYELIQVLSQGFGRDMTLPHVARATQRTSRWLVSLVEGREALSAEVGAIVGGPKAALGGEDAATGVILQPVTYKRRRRGPDICTIDTRYICVYLQVAA
jgi:hypothetical protein